MPASVTIIPEKECPTRTVGPSCRASTRSAEATASGSVVSGFCTDVALSPAACNRAITSDQDDPSAKSPCTKTTLRALVGVAIAPKPRVDVNEAAGPATRAAEKVRLLITMRISLSLLGRINRCATPNPGAHANDAAKGFGQMRLVRESAYQRNVRQLPPRGRDHKLGARHSSRPDIGHGRGPEASFERSREMTLPQSHAICDFSNPHFCSKIPLYLLESAASLRETASFHTESTRPPI